MAVQSKCAMSKRRQVSTSKSASCLRQCNSGTKNIKGKLIDIPKWA